MKVWKLSEDRVALTETTASEQSWFKRHGASQQWFKIAGEKTLALNVARDTLDEYRERQQPFGVDIQDRHVVEALADRICNTNDSGEYLARMISQIAYDARHNSDTMSKSAQQLKALLDNGATIGQVADWADSQEL